MPESAAQNDQTAWTLAQRRAQAQLKREVLGPRVSQSQFQAACDDVFSTLEPLGIEDRTCLQRLGQVLQSDDAQRDFIIRLNGLLHANRPIQDRFERFAAWLVGQDLSDWWLVSVFPALVFPDRFAVLDPASWRSSQAPRLPERLDWTAYRLAQQAAHVERKRLGACADLLAVHAAWLGPA
ncbi:MAG: hypothetical protein ACXIUB_00075 [Wenzhouxiangella sp.]